jgi:hypothetical protein
MMVFPDAQANHCLVNYGLVATLGSFIVLLAKTYIVSFLNITVRSTSHQLKLAAFLIL